MPDTIKQKALAEQERKQQLARLAELVKAAQIELPKRKFEWVEPKRHKPGERPKAVPLPNYTGDKGKVVPLPGNLSEPIRVQKLPYLIDTKPDVEEKTEVTDPKLPAREMDQQQKAQANKTPALFDYALPFSKGLEKILALAGGDPEKAGRLRKIVQESGKDPQSPAYNPYALGSTVDEAAQYFNVEAFDQDWLKKNRRILDTGNETANDDIAKVVEKKAELINKRMGSSINSGDLEAAVQNEKAAIIQVQGNALQLDIAPRSLTAHRSLLWEDGLLAGIPGHPEHGPNFMPTDNLNDKADGLAPVEGAVSSVANMIVNAAKAWLTGAAANIQTQASYGHMADKLLGISPEAVGNIASFLGEAVRKDANARKDTAGLVSLLMETGAGTLGAVTKYMLEGEEQPLPFLQTLSRLFMLLKAATGEKTDGEAVVKKALTEAVSKKMASTQVYTGNADFDTIATANVQSGNNTEGSFKRWGDAGINYYANLAEAGRSDIAAVLQTLPSYARAVVVAEQNMRTLTLTLACLQASLWR